MKKHTIILLQLNFELLHLGKQQCHHSRDTIYIIPIICCYFCYNLQYSYSHSIWILISCMDNSLHCCKTTSEYIFPSNPQQLSICFPIEASNLLFLFQIRWKLQFWKAMPILNLNILLLPHLLHLPMSQYQLLHSLFQEQQDPLWPQRTHPLPYPLRHT